MQYDKIHTCPNDCILYRKKFKDAISCPVCGEPRWQQNKNSEEIKVGTPAKVLWCIPPIPRFTRLFRNREHAKDLIWYTNERIEDGKLRHPVDSPTWKTIDYKWPSFGSDLKNMTSILGYARCDPSASPTNLTSSSGFEKGIGAVASRTTSTDTRKLCSPNSLP